MGAVGVGLALSFGDLDPLAESLKVALSWGRSCGFSGGMEAREYVPERLLLKSGRGVGGSRLCATLCGPEVA